MKLTYITNARIPTEKAHGYQICKMCEEFGALGVDVELLVPTRNNPIKDNAFQYYNLKNNFRINYLKSFDFIRFDKIFFRKSVYLQSLFFLFKSALVKIDKDRIVYTRNPELAWLFNLRGCKTAYECHDWFGKKKRLALYFLRNCNYIITTNNYIKNEFIKNGFKQNILVAPNGVNLEIFSLDITRDEALEKLKIDDDLRKRVGTKKILLYTGSFRTMGVDKGMDEIILALKNNKSEDIIFLAVGGNEKDIAHYENFAKENGVAEKCFFLGRRTQSDLALWQQSADILLMPFPDKAHYRYFMTPLKIFEYLAGGKPIIASDLPSIREILSEETCVFVKPGDADDLAEKINFVLNNKEAVNPKAEQAKKTVLNYTWGRRAKMILDFLV